MEWEIQVNNAAVIGVAADEEGLKALNIDAETWVLNFFLALAFRSLSYL
jgi:hypothetical protein